MCLIKMVLDGISCGVLNLQLGLDGSTRRVTMGSLCHMS
jgi:hypothetical protein